MKRQFVLFGGAGYIGRHLEQTLRSEGKHVVRIDRPGAVCEVEHDGNLVKTLNQVYQFLGSHYDTTDFIHLACPRNKPDTWDIVQAVEALEDGLEIAKRLPPGRRLFISSRSVYDEPPNFYGDFKRTAEVAAKMAGFGIIRLATVLGGNVCYRKDLGLHQIAAQLAEGHSAWVNESVARFVYSMEDTVDAILQFPRFMELGKVAYFKDIVGRYDVQVQAADDGNTYVATGGTAANNSELLRLRDMFEELVIDIKGGKVWPC